ncbi:MAG: bifunctional oligoribonuclease/PAP phosphatase NrnA [Elusimicrobiota bacterium]
MKSPRLPKIEEEFEKLKETVLSGDNFILAPHLNPDGDAIGSMLAFYSLLKRLGKKVFLFSQDPIPSNLFFLDGIKKIKRVLPSRIPKNCTAVLFECSVPKRAGDIEKFLAECSKVVNIDHHKTAQLYGDINILDGSSSSTAEIIYRFFYDIKLKINKNEAACLYTGIVTDTGRFHFPATSPRTHEIAALLLQEKFDFSKINDIIYATKPYPSLKLLGRALESLKLLNKGKIAVMTLKLSDFKEFSARAEHTENIINYAMMIPGVKACVLFKEEETRVTATFRSKDEIDVSKVASFFGGGGHKNASGCKLPLPLETAEKKIISSLLEIFK